MIHLKFGAIVCFLLGFCGTGQATTFFQGIYEGVINLAKTFSSSHPSPSKSISFSDDDDDLVVESRLSYKGIFCASPELESVAPESGVAFFEAWHQPLYVRYYNPLTIDALQHRLFCNLLETSQQRYLYPDIFYNPFDVVDQNYPLRIVELYRAPLPSMAATVESFSLLPREDPNSKA
ncbi:MAG: hypothetical protein K2W94_06050 [Alphaproteobacteria bacterium]|nr:hypothetical protein [Alphaproteobacteria bacterium]